MLIGTSDIQSKGRVSGLGCIMDAAADNLEHVILYPASSSHLDMAVLASIERQGRNDPETVKLTGIDNNLIRYWADL
jgi:hypothetical protein